MINTLYHFDRGLFNIHFNYNVLFTDPFILNWTPANSIIYNIYFHISYFLNIKLKFTVSNIQSQLDHNRKPLCDEHSDVCVMWRLWWVWGTPNTRPSTWDRTMLPSAVTVQMWHFIVLQQLFSGIQEMTDIWWGLLQTHAGIMDLSKRKLNSSYLNCVMA